MRRKQPSKEQIAAWREARVVHYADTRSLESLARMVVDLEDSHDCVPEFEIDDDWPEVVKKMKVK